MHRRLQSQMTSRKCWYSWLEGVGIQQLLKCSVPPERPIMLSFWPSQCLVSFGDPILKVLVQALENIPWGTEGALLGWVSYKHSMREKPSFAQAGKLISITGKGLCCTYWESNPPGWALPNGKLDLKPIPKGESETTDGLTVQSGYLERASNADVWSSALYSWTPPPTLRTRGCTALMLIY